MSKVYCGTEKLPKGKKLGTMEECVKAGQVRRFGLFSVDPMLLAAKIDTGPSENEYRLKVVRLKAKLALIGNRYKRAVDPDTKKTVAEEYRTAYEEVKAAIEAYDRVKKGDGPKKSELTLKPSKIKPKKGSKKGRGKKGSKGSKGSKKATTKKTTTKKPSATKKATTRKPSTTKKVSVKKAATRKTSKKLGRAKSRVTKRKMVSKRK